MAFTGPAGDRLKVRERFSSYSDAVFRGDVVDYLSCWTQDGVRTGPGGDCRGKSALREQWDDVWRAIERMAFFTQVAAIEVDGAQASARSYCLEIVNLKDGTAQKLVGRYDDDLVRQAGDWLFSRRNYQVILRF